MGDLNEGNAGATNVGECEECYPAEGGRGHGLYVVEQPHIRVGDCVVLGLQGCVGFVRVGGGESFPDVDAVYLPGDLSYQPDALLILQLYVGLTPQQYVAIAGLQPPMANPPDSQLQYSANCQERFEWPYRRAMSILVPLICGILPVSSCPLSSTPSLLSSVLQDMLSP